jgi:hypothetical protein
VLFCLQCLQAQYLPMVADYRSPSRDAIVSLTPYYRYHNNLKSFKDHLPKPRLGSSGKAILRCESCEARVLATTKITHLWGSKASTSKPQRRRLADDEEMTGQRRLVLYKRSHSINRIVKANGVTSVPSNSRIELSLDFSLLLWETCGCH